MKEQDEEPEDILQIDEHRLDRECIKLPVQYRQAAYQAAETSKDIDEAKAELKVAEASIHLKIRNTPGQFNLEKVTESAIDEVTSLNPKIILLEKKIRELEQKQAMEKILVSAIDYKKRSLNNLVELYAAGWHAQVRPSEEGRQALRKISNSRSPAIVRNRREPDSDTE
jgi:regulator of replication initiation timing